jgi:hypothetical protein
MINATDEQYVKTKQNNRGQRKILSQWCLTQELHTQKDS